MYMLQVIVVFLIRLRPITIRFSADFYVFRRFSFLGCTLRILRVNALASLFA